MEMKQNVPSESKRAMTTAALFTDIFEKHIERHVCENIPEDNSEELEQFASEILDHIIIVGGFCRDILLNRKINDIDIVINLRELCKLQTNHLKKYHSKKEHQDRNARCIYWERYLRKFDADGQLNEQQKNEPEMVAMHNLNYVFNARFWLDILRQNELLNNKLSVKDVAKYGFANIEIVNKVMYGNLDLDKQRIDIIDTFNLTEKHSGHDQEMDAIFSGNNEDFSKFHRESRRLSMSGIPIDSINRASTGDDEKPQKPTPGGDIATNANKSRPEVDAMDDDDDEEDDEQQASNGAGDSGTASGNKRERTQRLKSMAVIEFDIDELGTDFGNFGLPTKSRQEETIIAIEVPIYSGKVRYKLLNYDFSINTGILPLSNIIKLKDYNNQYANGNDSGPMTWVEIVENGLGECDAIEDCQTNKLLRCPETGHEDCTFEAHPLAYIFWRIVQWMIREPDFRIDQRLIHAQTDDYSRWMNSGWFAKDKNRGRFMKRMVDMLQTECTSMKDVEQMLKVMNQLEFKQRFTVIMDEVHAVRHDLADSIHSVENEQLDSAAMIALFKENGYNVEEQVFKVHSQVQEELETIQQRNAFLESQLSAKDETIANLRSQNEKLKQHIASRKPSEKDKERVQQLSFERDRLLQTQQDLIKAKKDLAVNAERTINELRQYLKQYENAVAVANSQK
mmetsp:Transcript_38972/g.62220  ORF Transcript_38972/g.62220 Transcript_38972/m.62220 type:complete len:680 (-) Transcript_38972:272-2311(-)